MLFIARAPTVLLNISRINPVKLCGSMLHLEIRELSVELEISCSLSPSDVSYSSLKWYRDHFCPSLNSCSSVAAYDSQFFFLRCPLWTGLSILVICLLHFQKFLEMCALSSHSFYKEIIFSQFLTFICCYLFIFQHVCHVKHTGL